MKDYTTDIESRKKFITKFEQTGKDIKIYLGDGNTHFIPNTEENITKLINIMKEQSSKFDKSALSMRKIKNTILSIVILILSLFLYKIFSLPNSLIPPTIGPIPTAFLPLIVSAYELIKNRQIDKIIEDDEKNKYFLKNEAEINEWLKKENVKVNSPKKVSKIIRSSKENGNILNINNIDSLSLVELERLKDIIEVEKNGNFNQYEKPKSLTKNKKNNQTDN